MQQVHVLLRHRLLPQPGGFEGFLAVDEDPDAPDLAVDEVVDVGNRGRREIDPTGPARGAALDERDNPVLADRLDALELEVEVWSGVADVGEEPSDALWPVIDTGDLGQQPVQLDVLRAAGEVAIDVALVDRSNGPRDDFNVLLRH